jgi:protease-4
MVMPMSRARKVFLVIFIIVVVLLIFGAIGIVLAVSAMRTEPAIRNNSVLEVRISGALPDYVPDDALRRIFNADDPSLSNLLLQIKKAKIDKRITGLLLNIGMTGAGWGKADEIRDAIADFKTSGKPVYAYMEYGSNKEYYIATACDKIYVAPIGDLFITGLASEAMFFRGSLDKLGIFPDFFQIGKYKNAPDEFTRKEMSPEHREVTNALLDDFFGRYVDAIAKTRNRSPEEVKAIIDNAPYRAKQAQAAGLIDGANYREEVDNELKKRLGYKDEEQLAITTGSAYRKATPEALGLNKGERIAIIYASGAIGSGKSDNSPFGSQTVGSETIVKALDDARDDKTIRAIVLRVDSPGGTSYASDLIWHAVDNAKKKKPVVVSMSDLGASGGYYIACDANKIVAEPSTITGSIGVFAGKPVLKGFYDWIGVSSEYVLRGKNAGLFRETEPFTKDERDRFESMIRSFYYDDFVPKVAQGRGRNPEYVDSIGQGHVWTGDQAKKNGLVDEFGGLDHALEVAKQLANIPADKGIHRVILPYPRGFLESLFDSDGESAKLEQQRAALAALPEDVRRTLQYASLLDHMQRGETMVLMPFDLRIK